MKDRIDDWLGRALVRWIGAVFARPRSIAIIALGLSAWMLVYAVQNLGINSDNVRLIPADLPSRQNHEAFAKLFPNLENAMLVVVDGETPELARDAARQLAARLTEQPERFTDVYLPGGGSFFENNGLLYRSLEELDEFADQMARIQPILGALEHDSSMASLTRLVRRGLDAARAESQPDEAWPSILDRIGNATIEIYEEFPLEISWEEVLLRGSAIEVTTRRVLVVHPVLDFDSILPGGAALLAIRESARDLDLAPERGVRVRVTGNPALNYEEMVGLAWDIGGAGVFCFVLVVGVLFIALRSPQLVAASVITLLVGLIWTAAFATAAIGHLNMVSMAVAVLFLGLGIDYAIHLGMRYADLLRSGLAHRDAFGAATRDVGGSLVICTVSTAIGFYVFVPTDYLGVAELGLIAGTGMFVILFHTFTLFPALLSSWLPVDPAHLGRKLRFSRAWWRAFERHGAVVRWTALAAGGVAVVLAPGARFDLNVIEMRDPTTETVQTFNDLLSQTGAASPWYVNARARNLDEAEKLSGRLEALEAVSHTITLVDYVPSDQVEKLEILSDVAFLLDSPPPAFPGKPQAEEVSSAEQIAAIEELRAFLDAPWITHEPGTLGQSMRLLRLRLETFLERVASEDDPDAALEALDRVLLASLPDQMSRLRGALGASPVTLEDLPEELAARMITPDGIARVQIFPRENLRNEQAFRLFVDSVREVSPEAAGIAINLVEFAAATKSSFRQALVSALLAISVLLWLLWRRVDDTLLVLTPLLLSAALTVGAVVLLDIPFNFANVIVIPLLLGIGVDSGIHLVHRSHRLAADDDGLLGSTTARAVFFSALTTTISFGSLAFSSHKGMASLGILLSVGMVLGVICNLIVLPSLIAWRTTQRTAAGAPPTGTPASRP